jgi:hypothetical protein
MFKKYLVKGTLYFLIGTIGGTFLVLLFSVPLVLFGSGYLSFLDLLLSVLGIFVISLTLIISARKFGDIFSKPADRPYFKIAFYDKLPQNVRQLFAREPHPGNVVEQWQLPRNNIKIEQLPTKKDKRTKLEKVKQLYMDGYTEREMAESLGVSERTIVRYKQELRDKGETK